MNVKRMSTLAILLLLAFVTACGNSTTGGGADDKARDKESDTRKYTSKHGTVNIPTHPQRIVAGGHLGSMIALGVKPVGAVKEWEADSPFLAGKVDGITDIGDPHNLETIAALNPDLIVLSAGEDMDSFSKIAPTVLIPYQDLKTVDEQITIIADLLGKQEEGKKWLDQFNQNAAEARQKVTAAIGEGRSAAIIGVMDGTIGVLGDRFGRGGQALYHVLQMAKPDKVQKLIDGDGTVEAISLELLPEVTADYLFVSSFNENDPAKQEMMKSSIWKGLAPVKEQHVFELDHQQFYFSDPVSIQGQLNLFVSMLTQK
ncbi:ABC transporter substrate-binding protein [Paenibacillus sp. ACRRX]|uniref:ABC transporter substrate-binding protein n=1 Tax=Paenibacillus sp. ACRRX TaxID=2918206 RepID=UPI001EF6F497|nr:ABC transporter substrate-binding protein [Paenibacillus sp. ACRRX]MCG7406913.1 ABC transporter substrate-binding protein [Paenibacillus sp. ACRRX]